MTSNQAGIQSKVSRGYGKGAKHLGAAFDRYRPLSTGAVIDPANYLQTILMAYDKDAGFNHAAPKGFADPFYYGLVDWTGAAIGDYYYKSFDETFYIANIEPLRPPMLVRCNRVVSVYGPAGDKNVNNGYGGNTSPIVRLTDWPAALYHNGAGGPNIATTPGSVADPGVTCYIPNFTMIHAFDIIIDDLDRRYVVAQNELTPLGYRLLLKFESP